MTNWTDRLKNVLGRRHSGRAVGRAVRATFEMLESRQLLSGNSISGIVYADANNNGLYESGEQSISGSTVALFDSQNQLVATTTTDVNGHYVFAVDSRIDLTPKSESLTLPFEQVDTDVSRNGDIQQFDPSLGTLTSVEVTGSVSLTSILAVENIEGDSNTITATVEAHVSLQGPSFSLTDGLSNGGTVTLGSTDGNNNSSEIPDYAGLDSYTFPTITKTPSTTVVLTASSDLMQYSGFGSVTFVNNGNATTSANDTAGNMATSFTTQVAASVTVVYHYTPFNSLQPGDYTIVQTAQPKDYLDGQETAGNVTPIANSANGPDSIHVNLGGSDLPNNNFGELSPASLSGVVYLDSNNNGIQDSGERGISGVTVTLAGIDDHSAIVAATAITGADGSYNFIGLRPGTYTLTEAQPAGYLDGKDTIGSQGGTVGNDVLSGIVLLSGTAGANYNFGELLGGSVQTGDTATIGFWNNKNGQALLKSLNGGCTSTKLANWLATTLPNLYGVNAGCNNLTNKTNADVAVFFKKIFAVSGQKLDAQVLAVAFAVYVTNTTLAGGNFAASYGFTVSSTGTGAKLYAGGGSQTVLQLLNSTNAQSVKGALYNNNNNSSLRNAANTIYDGINTKGDIV